MTFYNLIPIQTNWLNQFNMFDRIKAKLYYYFSGQIDPPCVNLRSYCGYYASLGYCFTYYSSMLKYCPVSCNFCTETSSDQGNSCVLNFFLQILSSKGKTSICIIINQWKIKSMKTPFQDTLCTVLLYAKFDSE